MGRRARPPTAPPTLLERVDALLADPRVAWLPIRHHSPGCAWHVGRWIREHRPAAVLIEGPDDAGELLPHLLHEETRPPVAVLSVWSDVDGAVRAPGPEGPARFRSLWPLVGHGPEWAALQAARELGLPVRLVDVPHDVLVKSGLSQAREVSDRPAAGRAAREAAWFERLAARTGRRSFAAFFDATFEARAHALTSEQWFRELLLFAAATRGDGDDGLAEDGTLLREAHMAWHVAQARKAFPDGRLAVVTGAFHAVALATTRPQRAKARGTKGVRVALATTSHASLVRLASIPGPGWSAALLRALERGEGAPADATAARLLVEVAARLRAAGHPVGTADAVAAVGLARGLAALRGGGPTALDVAEVATTAFVRGDASLGHAAARAVADEVLTGDARGHLPPGAGRPPLTEDFFAEARRHRVDTTGAPKVLRCDVLRDEGHRARSAFLHRASLLGLPLFDPLPDGQGPEWFKGPDPLREVGEHLLGETWGVRAADDLEDHLLELSDRGTTLAEAASAAVGALRARAGADLRLRTEVVVTAARLRLYEVLPDALQELGAALPVSVGFGDRVYALRELLALLAVHETLPTFGSPLVRQLAERAFTAACLLLPTLGQVRAAELDDLLDDLTTLLRAASFREGATLDREVLLTSLRALADGDADPTLRGAAAGARCALGDLSERSLAAAAGAMFRGAHARAGAAYLEGVLRTSRSTLLSGRRLFREVHELVRGLPPDVFRAVLPDLRRAFAAFVPSEVEQLGERVAELLHPADAAPPDAGPAVLARAAEVDARVRMLVADRV